MQRVCSVDDILGTFWKLDTACADADDGDPNRTEEKPIDEKRKMSRIDSAWAFQEFLKEHKQEVSSSRLETETSLDSKGDSVISQLQKPAHLAGMNMPFVPLAQRLGAGHPHVEASVRVVPDMAGLMFRPGDPLTIPIPPPATATDAAVAMEAFRDITAAGLPLPGSLANGGGAHTGPHRGTPEDIPGLVQAQAAGGGGRGGVTASGAKKERGRGGATRGRGRPAYESHSSAPLGGSEVNVEALQAALAREYQVQQQAAGMPVALAASSSFNPAGVVGVSTVLPPGPALSHPAPLSSAGNSSDNSGDEGDGKRGSGKDGEGGVEDIKRTRRMISNRESARRSRRRKQAHLTDLEYRVQQLKLENSSLLKRLGDVGQRYSDVAMDNKALRADVEALRAKLKAAEEAMTAASASGLRIPIDMSCLEEPKLLSNYTANGAAAAAAAAAAAGLRVPMPMIPQMPATTVEGKLPRPPSLQRVASLEHLQKRVRAGEMPWGALNGGLEMQLPAGLSQGMNA
eukprot:jgi/Mesvir1/19242/Mv03494-RA.1